MTHARDLAPPRGQGAEGQGSARGPGSGSSGKGRRPLWPLEGAALTQAGRPGRSGQERGEENGYCPGPGRLQFLI